jgi:hypothetical protein
MDDQTRKLLNYAEPRSDKYNAARKILSREGRLSSHQLASSIYAKMDELGYGWDGKKWIVVRMTHSRPE